MARGKKGIAAARRHGAEAVAATEETYQRRVAKLTAENKALKQRLTDQQSAHSREMKRIRVERDQGLSPEISVMREEIRRAKDDAQRSKQVAADNQKARRAMATTIHSAFMAIGLTEAEAYQLIVDMRCFTEGDEKPTGPLVTTAGALMFKTHVVGRRRLTIDEKKERATVLARARGERL